MDKKLSELILQILTNTLGDNDRMYWATSGGQDAYMTGATLKALASGNAGEVATYGTLPASPQNGKIYMVLNASGDPELSAATAAWYQYRTAIAGYVRICSVQELAAAAGDMTKAVYDPNDDGKVAAADLADNIAGTPGNNKFYGTDNAGNKGFYDQIGLVARTGVPLTGGGSGLDEVNITHNNANYYTHTPHAGGGGTLQTLLTPPDINNVGQFRLDTGGSIGSPGPAFDVSPCGILIIGGQYQTIRSINTLNYYKSAGILKGFWEETSYGSV